ncbi:hypothetical protein TNCV_867771 [Trichonephila clavipes]|nr:hypothetical protein TNCV_867771 [Trichonephila clavipes]
MEGKSYVWAEDDVVTAVGMFVLRLDDSGAKRRRRIPCDFQRTSLAGLALDSATSSGLGRAPALQCRTPSRHHLELQDRRDYTPADRAARTCWLGRPGLLYYLAV